MHTENIDICHYFLRYMLEDKCMSINYIQKEENPTYNITKNFSQAYSDKHVNRIKEVELWEHVETVRDNFKNNGVLDVVMDFD